MTTRRHTCTTGVRDVCAHAHARVLSATTADSATVVQHCSALQFSTDCTVAQYDRRHYLYIKLLGADGGGECKHRLGQTLTVGLPRHLL